MATPATSDSDPRRDLESAAERKVYPRSPLGVIALFVFLIEAVATASLKILLDADNASPHARYLVLFIVLLPAALIALFFFTLWFKRESLYGPSDFEDESNFIGLLVRRVEKVELRQEAARVELKGDAEEILAVVEDLLREGEYQSVLFLAGGLSKVHRHESCLRAVESLSGVPLDHELEVDLLSLRADSLNGLRRSEDALSELEKLRRLDQRASERLWPALAFAFAHRELRHDKEFNEWMEIASRQVKAPELLELASRNYPALGEELRRRVRGAEGSAA